LDYSFNPLSDEKFTDYLKRLTKAFTSLFIPYLDKTRDCLLPSQGANLLQQTLSEMKPMSKVEYLLLFALFLSLHDDLTYRINHVLDI